MNDQVLVKAVIKGDNSAMRELIARYQDLVLNTCYKVLQSREDAEDISQEVFIETFRSAAGLRYEENISFWLYRISLNKSINYLKRSNNIFSRSVIRLEALISHDDAGREYTSMPLSDDHPGETLETREKHEILAKAVASLPQKQQKAFILYHYEELSYKEICKILDLSLSSVESLLFRARENLKKKCAPLQLYKEKYQSHDT